MFMRRRPLLATAVVGGAAYHMGKKGAQASQQEAEQNAQIQELQQQAQPQAQQAPTPAMQVAAAAPAAGGLTEQLTQLKSLLDAGVLTQAEFETAKQKVLQGG